MMTKLKKPWGGYTRRWRIDKWYANNYVDYFLSRHDRPHNSRIKFEKLARKVLGNNNQITFEWQENGDCIVAGVIYLTVDTTV